MKNFTIVLVVVLLASYGFSFLDKKDISIEEEKIVQEVQPNQEVKPNVEDVSLHEDMENTFSLNYPNSVSLRESFDYPNEELALQIKITEMDEIEDLMGYDQESSLANEISLAEGEYGNDADFPLGISKKVKNLEKLNAQEFMVLGRFEICDVTFERKLMFFKEGKRFLITLKGPRSEIIASMPEFFEKNEANCGEALIWNFEKQEDFYKKLEMEEGSKVAQEWFDAFDIIVDSITLYPIILDEEL